MQTGGITGVSGVGTRCFIVIKDNISDLAVIINKILVWQV